MKKPVIMIAVVCLTLIASAQDKAPQQPVTAFPIGHPFDAVWSAVIETFSDLYIPIQNIEKDSGLFTTDLVLLNNVHRDAKTYVTNCKTGPVIYDKTWWVRFNIFVKKIGEESELKIKGQFLMMVHNTNGTRMYDCATSGIFEKKIFNAVMEKLGWTP